jgi:hypothetical protein
MFGSALQRRAYSSSSADDLLQYERQYGRGEDKHQWHTYPRPAPPQTSHPPRITYMKRNSAESGKRGGTHRLDGGRTAGVESRAGGAIANDVPPAAGGQGGGVAAGVSSSSASPSGRLLHSNLDCFLDVTTPKVKPQTLRKSCLRDPSLKRCIDPDGIPFFSLGDLWDSFDEWSAYGAGVPLMLNGDENVVQYYVPYVSALQLYTLPSRRPHVGYR